MVWGLQFRACNLGFTVLDFKTQGSWVVVSVPLMGLRCRALALTRLGDRV